jgi:hypothetical protein
MPDLHEILDALARFPVVVVVAAGMLFGGGFTQLVKKTYLAFAGGTVSVARYRITVRWLAALSTYSFTIILWHETLGHSGYEQIVAIGSGAAAPLCYDLLKAGLKWKWPQLTAGWGDDD